MTKKYYYVCDLIQTDEKGWTLSGAFSHRHKYAKHLWDEIKKAGKEEAALRDIFSGNCDRLDWLDLKKNFPTIYKEFGRHERSQPS